MGQQRALVIGVSNYPPPIPSLPGVANDAKAMADLLGSPQGQFRGGDVTVLTDAQATGAAIREQLDAALGKAGWDDTVFVYMAGHGKIHNGAYYFAAHDTDRGRLAETGVALADLRALFDASQSRRVFVWLDFCHSGGVIERDLAGGAADARPGCDRADTPGRRARQDHRHGLHRPPDRQGIEGPRPRVLHPRAPGGAAGGRGGQQGRVLATTLYTHVVDRVQAESHDQSPVWHGQMEGHILLMHYPDRKAEQGAAPPGRAENCDSVRSRTGRATSVLGGRERAGTATSSPTSSPWKATALWSESLLLTRRDQARADLVGQCRVQRLWTAQLSGKPGCSQEMGPWTVHTPLHACSAARTPAFLGGFAAPQAWTAAPQVHGVSLGGLGLALTARKRRVRASG